MKKQMTRTTFTMEVCVTVLSPHSRVDTETLEDAAKSAVTQNLVVIPRYENDGKGPEFEVSSEVMSCEIEDDDREAGEFDDEFSADLRWWQDLSK